MQISFTSDAVLKNIPKKDKKEVAYMLKDALEDESKMQELAVILEEKGHENLLTQLIDSDSTFGTTNHFPDSTGEEYELLTARRESTRS